MKITKRQLRRIIQEEKQKLLKESVTDIQAYQDMITKQSEDFAYTIAEQFARKFARDMEGLYIEEPEAFAVEDPAGGMIMRQTQEEWNAEVDYASEIIIDEISSLAAPEVQAVIKPIIEDVIATIEAQLHDGAFGE